MEMAQRGEEALEGSEGERAGGHVAGEGPGLFWGIAGLVATLVLAAFAWQYAYRLGATSAVPEKPAAAAAPQPQLFPVRFDGTTFSIDQRLLLQIRRRSASEIDSIRLALPWPPPTLAFLAGEAPSAGSLSLREGLFVTIRKRTNDLSLDDRLTGIYPVYLAGEPESGPSGLTRQDFSETSVYEGYDLLVGETGARAVHYLCFKTERPLVPALCRGERQIDGAFTAVYRFHRSHLGDWERIEERITQLVADLTRPAE